MLKDLDLSIMLSGIKSRSSLKFISSFKTEKSQNKRQNLSLNYLRTSLLWQNKLSFKGVFLLIFMLKTIQSNYLYPLKLLNGCILIFSACPLSAVPKKVSISLSRWTRKIFWNDTGSLVVNMCACLARMALSAD